MVWFKVDDGLASALKTTRIPRARRAAAIGLWVLAGSWSARELTDGFVPEHMVDELAGTPTMVDDLVSAEYWAVVDGGWQMADWQRDQFTRDEVEAKRRKNADKVANWRQARRQDGKPAGNPVTGTGTNPVGDPAPVPTRPDPSRPIENASHSPARATVPAIVDEVVASFERAWKHWPKKADKKTSLARYRSAIKARGTLAQLEADVIRFGQAYARSADEMRFVPGLSTWLNRERWGDDLPTPSLNRPMTRTEQNLAVVARLAAPEQRPTRGQEHLAYIDSLEARDESRILGTCGPGNHKLAADGTCALCTASAWDIGQENPF